MTVLDFLSMASDPVVVNVLDQLTTGEMSDALGHASKFDNQPTWDNKTGGGDFDNRPTWDNWSKR